MHHSILFLSALFEGIVPPQAEGGLADLIFAWACYGTYDLDEIAFI